MNLRLVQFKLATDVAAESIATRVVPAIRAMPGCQRCEFFADSGEGDYGIVVLWESREKADAAALVIGPILTPALRQAGATSDSIRLYDVYEVH